MGDRRHIKQILVNLASNAIKFNDAGGSVTFGWSRRTPDTVRVTVADDGPGIAADKLDRIFTPFDRLGAEESTVEGTGIGLALSQRLAELQGAALSLDSEPGRGSTFALDLRLAVDPLAGALDGGPDGADAMTAVTHTEPVVPAGHHGTILYVEDNPSNLRLVQRVLDRRGGIRLVTAGTAHMALSLVARVPIDLVLLDLHLPDLQGDEVLARLRRDPTTASIPVVIVSADASPGRIERLRAAGADDFLTKPLDLAHLLQVVDDRLAGARA
jgi:CheY-like chemotaxis protein